MNRRGFGVAVVGWVEGHNLIIEYRWLWGTSSDCRTSQPSGSDATWM